MNNEIKPNRDELDDRTMENSQDHDRSYELLPEEVGVHALEKKYEDDSEDPGDLVMGLDIGTTKICCILAEVTDKSLKILSLGTAASISVKKGIISNLEATSEVIKKAVEEATAGLAFDWQDIATYVGVSGEYVRSFSSPGIVGIRKGIVRQDDVDAVHEAAKTINIPESHEVLHMIPQVYMVDSNAGIQNPLGLSGVRLVSEVHMSIVDKIATNNISSCCQSVGLSVQGFVLDSIASATATLNAEEKENGVLVLDIGGGSTDIAVYYGGTVRYSSQIPLGGHSITNDIAFALKTPLAAAELLKESYGSAVSAEIKANYVVEVPSRGDKAPRKVTQKFLVEIIEARVLEILELAKRNIEENENNTVSRHSVVLTGGTSLLPGIADLAEQVFDLPVRIGYPVNVAGEVAAIDTPRCVTAVGLIAFGRSEYGVETKSHLSFGQKIIDFFKKRI